MEVINYIFFMVFVGSVCSLPWVLLLGLTRNRRWYRTLWMFITVCTLCGDMMFLIGLFTAGHGGVGGPVAPFGAPLQYVLLFVIMSSPPTTIYAFTLGHPDRPKQIQ
jgi:hypothetical protein